MTNIIYSDKEKVLLIMNKIKKGGVGKLHFLADFDNTLTKTFVNGEKTLSMVATLRSGEKLLGEGCAREDKELLDKYHPIEFDSTVDIESKKVKMIEWWTASFSVFIKYGLNLKHIKHIATSGFNQFRDGTLELFKNLDNNNIPIVIISASGIGKKAINYFFDFNNILFKNISIISNDYNWDVKGDAVSYKLPIIHSFNKDETVLEEFPEIHSQIESRKNIILLGDSMGDPHMVDGFKYDNLLKVGFLNYNEDENLNTYKEKYDIIITGDGDFTFLNNYLKEFLV